MKLGAESAQHGETAGRRRVSRGKGLHASIHRSTTPARRRETVARENCRNVFRNGPCGGGGGRGNDTTSTRWLAGRSSPGCQPRIAQPATEKDKLVCAFAKRCQATGPREKTSQNATLAGEWAALQNTARYSIWYTAVWALRATPCSGEMRKPTPPQPAHVDCLFFSAWAMRPTPGAVSSQGKVSTGQGTELAIVCPRK